MPELSRDAPQRREPEEPLDPSPRLLDGVVVWRVVRSGADVLARVITPAGRVQVSSRGGGASKKGRSLPLFEHQALVMAPARNGFEPSFLPVSNAQRIQALHGLDDPLRFACAGFLGDLAWKVSLALPEPTRLPGGGWQENAALGAPMIYDQLTSALRGVAEGSDPAWAALVMGWRMLVRAGYPRQISAPLEADPWLRLLPRGCWEFAASCCALPARDLLCLQVSPGDRLHLWRDLERYCESEIGTVRSIQVVCEMLSHELAVQRMVAQRGSLDQPLASPA